jgi:hypothetical protein
MRPWIIPSRAIGGEVFLKLLDRAFRAVPRYQLTRVEYALSIAAGACDTQDAAAWLRSRQARRCRVGGTHRYAVGDHRHAVFRL